MGDSIHKFPVQSGETVTAHIDIQSREFNGRWYPDVKAWRIEREGRGGSRRSPDDEPPLPDQPEDMASDDDEIPF